jgi:hypothetical protein
MISESAYIEVMKNCSKWNSRIVSSRKRSNVSVYDQQTGIVQKPTEHLYRNFAERCQPENPMQVVAYPAKRWHKTSEIPSDACEMKYILTNCPALNDAVNALSNTNGNPAQSTMEVPVEQTGMPLRSNTNKNYEAFDLDSMDYDFEDMDDIEKDEEEWGARKKRKKQTGVGSGNANRHSRRSAANFMPSTPSMSAATSSNASDEIRPFVCSHCNARYKSRPGLQYHRLHVHADSSAPKKTESPIPSTSSPIP